MSGIRGEGGFDAGSGGALGWVGVGVAILFANLVESLVVLVVSHGSLDGSNKINVKGINFIGRPLQ